jgi:transcriptional regulator with XRE-family HTH domain
MLVTSARADACGPWLWGMFLTTSNTASTDYHALGGKKLRYEQIFGLEQATSNTAHDVQRLTPVHTDAGPAILTRAAQSHASLPVVVRVRDAIYELRRLSGLTWEDLADLLSVTRRSLHLWANGGPINTPNERHVRDLLMALRVLDRGTARENRSLILMPGSAGGTFADLLRARRFEEAIELAGRGRGRPLSQVADAGANLSRPPKLSVADMLGTSAERVHTDEGRVLPSRWRRPRL